MPSPDPELFNISAVPRQITGKQRMKQGQPAAVPADLESLIVFGTEPALRIQKGAGLIQIYVIQGGDGRNGPAPG